MNRLGADLRRRSGVEPGVEKHPGRGFGRRPAGAPPLPAARAGAKRCAAVPASAFASCRAGRKRRSGRCGRWPATDANMGIAPGCRHPSARRIACAESAGAAPGACRRCRCRAEPGLDVADPDARDRRRRPAPPGQALVERRHAGSRLQRVLRRDQPPHFVEPETAQRQPADMQVPAMRRVERPAQQPDAASAPTP